MALITKTECCKCHSSYVTRFMWYTYMCILWNVESSLKQIILGTDGNFRTILFSLRVKSKWNQNCGSGGIDFKNTWHGRKWVQTSLRVASIGKCTWHSTWGYLGHIYSAHALRSQPVGWTKMVYPSGSLSGTLPLYRKDGACMDAHCWNWILHRHLFTNSCSHLHLCLCLVAMRENYRAGIWRLEEQEQIQNKWEKIKHWKHVSKAWQSANSWWHRATPKLVSQVLCHFSLRSNPKQLQQFASHLERKPVIPCWLARHQTPRKYIVDECRWLYLYPCQLSRLVISTQNKRHHKTTTNPHAQSTMFIFNTRVLNRT